MIQKIQGAVTIFCSIGVTPSSSIVWARKRAFKSSRRAIFIFILSCLRFLNMCMIILY